MSRPRAKVGDLDFFELARQRQVEKHQAAVAARHEMMRVEGKERGSRWTQNRGRLAEITALIRSRHGGPVDTAEGTIYLEVAIPHLIEKCGLGLHAEPGKVDAYVHRWARVATPLVPVVEVDKLLSEARSRNRRRKLHWSAQAAGDRLAISKAERKKLGIVTMRPAGMDDAEFEAYQRAEATAREQARRIREGATPQAESKAARMRTLASELGVSISTVKRKLGTGELTLPAVASVREQRWLGLFEQRYGLG